MGGWEARLLILLCEADIPESTEKTIRFGSVSAMAWLGSNQARLSPSDGHGPDRSCQAHFGRIVLVCMSFPHSFLDMSLLFN